MRKVHGRMKAAERGGGDAEVCERGDTDTRSHDGHRGRGQCAQRLGHGHSRRPAVRSVPLTPPTAWAGGARSRPELLHPS